MTTVFCVLVVSFSGCCCRLGHAYDPDAALWNFSPYGPFCTEEELASSPLMQRLADGLRFAVVRRGKARRSVVRCKRIGLVVKVTARWSVLLSMGRCGIVGSLVL